MEYHFDVEKIVDYLKQFKDNLPDLYKWNPKIDNLVELGVLESSEIDKLHKSNPYEREIILKERVHIKIRHSYENDQQNFDKLCLWIIKDWGGIRAAKDKGTIELISAFLKTETPSYKRITSASKVGAYMYPEKHTIYDSRVVYSLNWIILSENAGDLFFPIPSGRNSKMNAFDMNVLIRMKNASHYTPIEIEEMGGRYIKSKDKKLYIPEKESYSELNRLIKKIHQRLWDSDKSEKLFYTEMLLFSIADTEVFKDITERIEIIKKK